MRTTRIALALALLVSPAMLSAQTAADDFCSATLPAGAPTCAKTKAVSATISNILYLGIINNGPINLAANDTAAYEKTWRANGNAAGTTGTAVTTALTLQSAAAADSVVVRANRGYKLTIQATTDLFSFDKDAGYNTCRTSAVATAGCTTTEALAGKPVTDLYYATDAATFAQIPLSTGTAATIKNSTTGERFAKAISFKSAWFYATDIPGVYTATVRYTVTGQ